MVNQKLGFITVAICFGYITTLTGLKGRNRVLLFFRTQLSRTFKHLRSHTTVHRLRKRHHIFRIACKVLVSLTQIHSICWSHMFPRWTPGSDCRHTQRAETQTRRTLHASYWFTTYSERRLTRTHQREWMHGTQGFHTWSTVWVKKSSPPKLFAIFSLRLSIFSWNFASLLSVHIYICLPILVDLS